jgi:hypothetical protein
VPLSLWPTDAFGSSRRRRAVDEEVDPPKDCLVAPKSA